MRFHYSLIRTIYKECHSKHTHTHTHRVKDKIIYTQFSIQKTELNVTFNYSTILVLKNKLKLAYNKHVSM